MYIRYYKIHAWLLALGIFLFVGAKIAVKHSFYPMYMGKVYIVAAVLFVLSMVYYYKIMSVLAKVSDITSVSMWISIAAHIATLTSLFFFENHKEIFFILFFVSVLVRKLMGTIDIDRQMKNLCYELDMEIIKLAFEENEKERQM